MKAGKPEHIPSETDRENVKKLVGLGLRQEEIASFIGINKSTLLKHYESELRDGIGFVKGKIGNALMQKIDDGDTAAIIFASKTRLGLSEKSGIDVKAGNGKLEIKFVDAGNDKQE